MPAPGYLVRRKKRIKSMVVLSIEGDSVLCGWTGNGKFYKRTFPKNELIVLTPYSGYWPFT